MNVAYQGPLLDYSGYGEANRHAVAALKAAGVNVIGKLLSYSHERSEFGTMGAVVAEALKTKAAYNIKIMHTTPDEFGRLINPARYNIAHFFWETDKVPAVFADGLNMVDEIWTGSQANKDAIEAGGVTKPIYIFPQALETDREWPAKYEVPGFPDDGYLFYSIFEWIDRKNPELLIRAFYEEFHSGEKVGLLLKTYLRNFTFTNKTAIRDAIKMIKASMSQEQFPPLMLYLDLMSREQVMRIHSTGDCFVSAHRGEGWGVPQAEALLRGNPIISTGYGGIHEYLADGKDATLLPFSMQPVRGMSQAAHLYSSDQNWAEVDIKDLRSAMRWAYENQSAAADIGLAGQDTAMEQFNLNTVGQAMAERLREIERTL